MGEKVLTSQQEAVIATVAAAPELTEFYLTGGTALAAYYLEHRRSDDLDFFSFSAPDALFLHAFANRLEALLGAEHTRFQKLYDRYQFFFIGADGELKVEFAHYPFVQLEPALVRGAVRVDSARDIAANKLMAILDRFDPKDFVDLYFLLVDHSLAYIRRDAQLKFGTTVDPVFLGGELAKVRRIEALPNMIKALTVAELKQFFADRAVELAPEVFG